MSAIEEHNQVESSLLGLNGQKGLIFGVANHRSIAWAVASELRGCGVSVGLSVLDERAKKRAQPLIEDDPMSFIQQCDVRDDEDLTRLVRYARDQWGHIDFIIHSIAFAHIDDLNHPISACPREGFLDAMEVSAHSLLKVTHACLDELSPQASIVTLSYLGAEVAIPSYGLMGPVKAALEAEVRYLAAELGPRGIRVNTVSAGPLKTLAASAIPGFRQQLKESGDQTPLKRPITHQEVAHAVLFLCSPMSKGITGETLHVDAGHHAVRPR